MKTTDSVKIVGLKDVRQRDLWLPLQLPVQVAWRKIKCQNRTKKRKSHEEGCPFCLRSRFTLPTAGTGPGLSVYFLEKLEVKKPVELQTWQSLLESKQSIDKNRSIEYFQRKKKISYLKESKFWLNLFLFLETKWGFLTKQLSKLQNVSEFKESGGCCWFAVFNRSAQSAPRNGTVWGRSHQPPQTCGFPNSFLISPEFFAATAAGREGCLGAAHAFWISQPVWASDSHVSLYSPRGEVLTSASCLWHQAALCQVFALCCVLEGPCWKPSHASGAMQTLNCR